VSGASTVGGLHRRAGFDAEAVDFGGVWRVVLTHRGNRGDTGNDKLVAFLHQP
jgi:hypothetical protein